MAAQFSAAGPDAAHHLRLVAYADLAQLDAHLEYAGQVLDQFPEIHSAVRREIEDDLGIVERIFHVHEFHLQAVFVDLLLAQLQRSVLLLQILLVAAHVVLVRLAQDGLERRNDLVLIHFRDVRGERTEFDASGRFYDNVVPGEQFHLCRVKIIDFTGGFKSHACNSDHISS